MRFDAIILGGGNAGFGASAVLAEAGKRIAFVESHDFGGTCPNRGCTPKKVLVAAAEALDTIARAGAHGIKVGPATLDWAALIAREKAMIAFIPDAMAGVAEKRGTVFRGPARFKAPDTVVVGDTSITGEAIIIATGSTPRPLPIPGAEHLATSDDVLSAERMPDRVVFIGGGVIAMEFSHVYARAGAVVTVLEVMPQILPGLDAEAVAVLRTESERIGITIRTGVSVESITPEGGGLRVRFTAEGRADSIVTESVVNGAGRVARVAGLDLDAGGVAHDGVRVAVDAHLRSTSNPAVWVCGDALVGPPQLSPLATIEGRLVAENILAAAEGRPLGAPDYACVPSCVFTVPALASVGLTGKEAEGRAARVVVSDMAGWFSGKSYAESVAWAKVIVDEASDRILGAHMIGHHGEELIHLFALAMKHGITAAQLKETVFAFPTFSSDIKNIL